MNQNLHNLFEELKRRRVIRVATLYVLIFWPIIQITDIASAALGLPDAAMRYLVFAFLGGLPVLLTLAWLFDLNRDGIVRDHGGDDETSTGQALIGSKLEIGIIGFMAVVVAGLFYVQLTLDESPTATATAKEGGPVAPAPVAATANSVAVLPFDTFSGDQQDRFFADGLSEELLNVLARVRQLEVAARTSSFAYRGSRKTVPVIGHELGVNYILEGSVRRNDVNDEIRVTAQLIDVGSGAHLWSETYDRQFADIFAIQDEIARAVVDSLKVELLGNDADDIRSHASASGQAMIAYSMGQTELAKRTKTGIADAARFFQRALDEDPNYAEAWVGLADARALQVSYGYDDEGDGLERAQEAVDRALELDPELGLAWASQGLIYLQDKANTSKAHDALARAVELNPNYAMAHMWYAQTLDDPAEKFERYQRAYKLDPRSPVAGYNVAQIYAQRGREAEAMEVFNQIIEADPNYDRAYFLAATVSANRGRFADAIRNLETAWELNEQTEAAYQLAYLNNMLGNYGVADEWAAIAKPGEPRENLFRYELLMMDRYAMQGEIDKAIEVGANLATPRGDGFADYAVATVAAWYSGSFEKTIEYWEETRRILAEQGHPDMDMGADLLIAVGHSLIETGDIERGTDLLDEARAWVNVQLDGGQKEPGLWYDLAQLEAIEGNTQMALINLQRATSEGWRDYWMPQLDPALVSIRQTRELETMMAGVETQMSLMREQFAFERAFATVPNRDGNGS